MTDCQLGVIKPRLLNSEKRKATSLLLLDLNITLGLQESIAFKWKIQCKLPPKTKRFCPLVLK